MFNDNGMIGIHAYDGYLGEPFWRGPENYSTYYDFIVDKQCKVPIRDISEVRKEMESLYPDIRKSGK